MSHIGDFSCTCCHKKWTSTNVASLFDRQRCRCGVDVRVDQNSVEPLFRYECTGCHCTWRGRRSVTRNCRKCGRRAEIKSVWDPSSGHNGGGAQGARGDGPPVELPFVHSDNENSSGDEGQGDKDGVLKDYYESLPMHQPRYQNNGYDDQGPGTSSRLMNIRGRSVSATLPPKARRLPKVIECCMCLERMGPARIADFGCHMNTCTNCAKEYLEKLIEENQIRRIVCPHPTCNTQIPQHVIRDLVKLSLFFKLEEMLLKAAGIPDIVTCPKPNCERITQAFPEYGFCKSCDYRFCTNCNQAYHGALKCYMTEEETTQMMLRFVGGGADQAEMRQMEPKRQQQNVASERLIRQLCKKCPTCPANIQKDQGCNTMQCTNCETLCGYKLSTAIEGDPHKDPHFTTASRCRLFEVPVELRR